MNGGAGLLQILSVQSGDEEVRRVQALAVIFETTPNVVIREACSFYLSYTAGAPGYHQAAGRTCMGCQMADPPPEMTCRLGRDHRVGTAAGCPGCGRLMAACALRPCSAWREAPQDDGDLPGRSAMTAAGHAGGSQPRGVFDVDEGRVLAGLELTWAGGGYHGFSAGGGTWSAISSAGDVLTGDTPDALNRAIRADWAREGTR